MKDKLEALITAVCKDVGHFNSNVVLERPDYQFGDYTTNIALQLANSSGKSPRDLAELIVSNLKSDLIDRVEVAGPGFINLFLSPKAIFELLNSSLNWPKSFKGEQVVVESGDPNPFKEMHVGHLYDAVIGDAIASLYEANGASVKRVSYHGDVGLHVAKWLWAVGTEINWDMNKLDTIFQKNGVSPLGYYYAKGAQFYEVNKKVADEIQVINRHIYQRDNDDINQIYDAGKKLSFDLFDEVFAELNIKFNKRYLESQCAEIGVEIVKKNTPKVFKQSQGAIIYEGEKANLHTRVFINSKGLPTYEAKELGLAELKNKDYPSMDRSIYLTANEQTEYFRVVIAALGEIDPKTAKKIIHIAHGFLSLTTGKMSSRTGKVAIASELLEDVQKEVTRQFPESKAKHAVYLAAIKYTFLKQRIGPDVVFDLKESVSLSGNSGPYIQYAYVRAKSVLNKVGSAKIVEPNKLELETSERALAVKIGEYPEIIGKAIAENLPSHICTYLYELASTFNNFYEQNRVIDHERSEPRTYLVSKYAEVLKNGLELFNIPVPDKM